MKKYILNYDSLFSYKEQEDINPIEHDSKNSLLASLILTPDISAYINPVYAITAMDEVFISSNLAHVCNFASFMIDFLEKNSEDDIVIGLYEHGSFESAYEDWLPYHEVKENCYTK